MIIVFDEMVHETDLGYLMSFEDTDLWVPKSIVKDINEYKSTVTVATWFVYENDLEMYEE